MSSTVTTSDARTNLRPVPSSGTTSTQSPNSEVPLTPKLLTHSSASLIPSRSCVFPFASVTAIFTGSEGYGPQVDGVQQLGSLAAEEYVDCAAKPTGKR